jgi:nitrate/nitrite transporter NarK
MARAGVVEAAGALGGFVSSNALGSLRQLTQSYGGGFPAFAVVGGSGAVALFFVGRTWEGRSLGKAGVACGPGPGNSGYPQESPKRPQAPSRNGEVTRLPFC